MIVKCAGNVFRFFLLDQLVQKFAKAINSIGGIAVDIGNGIVKDMPGPENINAGINQIGARFIHACIVLDKLLLTQRRRMSEALLYRSSLILCVSVSESSYKLASTCMSLRTMATELSNSFFSLALS